MKKIKASVIALLVLTTIIIGSYLYLLYPQAIPEPSLSASLQSKTILLNGHQRTFHYYVPQKLKSEPALVFVFHSSLSSGKKMRERTAYQFDVIADKEGFIVAYPDGYDRHWNDCRASADYAANIENINDVVFVTQMRNWFSSHYGINTKRVYATGYSNGGHLSFRLAMETPNLVAAIAPIAANLPVTKNLDCKPKGQAISISLFNGTADSFNPYEGGLVSILGNESRGEVLSSKDTINYWLKLAGYQNVLEIRKKITDSNKSDQSTIEISTWQQEGGPEINLYTIMGGGHSIPSKLVSLGGLFGDTNADIESALEIWNFFERDWQQQHK
ncbi:MAG: dienelactone hydrolase family protein [Bermanella sp.]